MDWPLYRGQAARSGAVPDTPPPCEGGVNWSFKHESKTFFASPAVVGNRIYITSAEKGVFTDRGAIYCLDSDTGAMVWKSAPDGFRATFSSPSVSGKYLVVGEGLHYTYDARIVCLDITQGGKLLWQLRTTNHVESTACIYNKRAYIGAGDDGYYCVELEPGPNGQPRVVWHVTRDQYPDAETAPVADDGKIYAGLGMNGNALVCLDANKGQELWRLPTPYPVFTPATIVAGKIIIGMGNGNLVETADEVMIKELTKLEKRGASPQDLETVRQHLRAAGEVWAIDSKAAQGTKKAAPPVAWRFKASDTILGAIAASDDGRLYFGSRDGWFYCLSTTGQELGRWNARAAILTSPAIAGNCVYFVTGNGKLYALDRLTLQPLWEVILGTPGLFVSSPVVARGHVYVGTQNDGLLSVGNPGGRAGKSVWAGFLGGPGKPGSLEPVSLPERGSLLWRWPQPGEDATNETPPPVITAPAALLGKLLCVPIARGGVPGLLCLTNACDAKQSPAQSWLHETTNGIYLSPALGYTSVGSNTPDAISNQLAVFMVDGRMGDNGRQLYRLRAENGTCVWKHPVGNDASGVFCLMNSLDAGPKTTPALLIQDQRNSLAALDMGGQVCCRSQLGSLRGAPAVEHQLAIVATVSPSAVIALDLPSGQILWEQALPATTGPVLQENNIFIGLTNGLAALRLKDGATIWHAESGAASQPLVAAQGLVTYATGQEAVLVDMRNGKVMQRIPHVEPSVPPVLTRDTLLYASRDSILAYNLVSGQTQRWMSTGWLGTFTSPFVMQDGSVFFATDRKGFIRSGRR